MNSYGALDSLAEGVASRQPCHEAGSSNREDNNIQLGPLDGSSGFEMAMRSGSHSRGEICFCLSAVLFHARRPPSKKHFMLEVFLMRW